MSVEKAREMLGILKQNLRDNIAIMLEEGPIGGVQPTAEELQIAEAIAAAMENQLQYVNAIIVEINS